MSRARVLIADDHPAVTAELRSLLEKDFDVVATVGDGLAAVEAARSLRPDLVVLDLAMPGLDGIQAATQIMAFLPDTRIVIVTVHRDPTLMAQVKAMGIAGYVMKAAAGDQLIPTLKAALQSPPKRVGPAANS
jgi:DNA-binding NarL/FixJ family response regulator